MQTTQDQRPPVGSLEDLLERNRVLSTQIVELIRQNHGLWRQVIDPIGEQVKFANDAFKAQEDAATLSHILSVLGAGVRANRLAVFEIRDGGVPILIAGWGPDLPKPGERIVTEDRQAPHILRVWHTGAEYVSAPVPGTGFDSFWAIRSEQGGCIAILGVDDTEDARQFQTWELERMREIVALLQEIVRELKNA